MRFWDSSAIVPLVIAEPQTSRMSELLAEDPDAYIWMLTPVEIASAIWRRLRESQENEIGRSAETLLVAAVSLFEQVKAVSDVADVARVLIARHPLTAADALQLAAAIVAREHKPALQFVTLDNRLADAARAERFVVLP